MEISSDGLYRLLTDMYLVSHSADQSGEAS